MEGSTFSEGPATRRIGISGCRTEGGVRLRAGASELTSGGSPLPDTTRQFYEARMGRDFSSVRLHCGRQAHHFNGEISARAFTYRNHIWLGPNEPLSPSVTLAHELAHVMQQTSPGRWGPTGGASAAPPSIQRQLTPPGNCIQGIHDGLQRLVKAWCDHPSGRRCSATESCHRLRQKIRRNQLCAQHRRTINDRCYEGGDSGHRRAERDARRTQGECMVLWRNKCDRRRRRQRVRDRAPRVSPAARRVGISAMIGAGLGTVLGAIIGGVGGGAGGTLVAPGVGTIGGGVAGGVAGAAKGAAIGGLAGAAVGAGLQSLYEWLVN